MSNERALAPVDPNVFLAFDRLDDNQIVQEMKGAALQEYVYEFTSGNKPVRGLSKAGTDDAARIMALQYGEVLREDDCWMEAQDDEAAYFKARVCRYVIRKDGSEMRMDSAVGHKRQPKKNQYGKANEFWYEQGGQKALRNAKQKLIPEAIKQAIIASYVEQGKVRRVRAEEVQARSAPATAPKPAPQQPAPQSDPAQSQEQTSDDPNEWAGDWLYRIGQREPTTLEKEKRGQAVTAMVNTLKRKGIPEAAVPKLCNHLHQAFTGSPVPEGVLLGNVMDARLIVALTEANPGEALMLKRLAEGL